MTRLTELCSIAIQVTEGTHERFVLVEATNDPPPPPITEEPLPGTMWFVPPVRPAEEVVPAYLDGIAWGLHAGPAEGERGEVLHASTRQDGAATARSWELRLPALAPAGLLPLVRMLATSTGVREIRLTEKAAADKATLRSAEALGEASRPKLPWTVDNTLGTESKASIVTVVFEDDVPPDLEKTTLGLFGAWTHVVSLGGFSGGREWPCSGAAVEDMGSELASEPFVSFRFLTCAADGWGALEQGLLRIHALAPIKRVEMH